MNFCYSKIIHILPLRYHLKIIGHIKKISKKASVSVCIHEIIRLIKMKMEMKMKNRSYRYDISRPRSRQGHK